MLGLLLGLSSFAIARVDGIPRRLTESINKADGTPVGPPPSTITYSSVKINATIDPALFTQKMPEGFAKVDAPQKDDQPKQPDNVVVMREGKPVEGDAKADGITAIPTLILINKDGTIAKADVGVDGNPEKDLRAAITKALAK